AEPSPLCHEILNGRPYTFLDDAPLEERRTRAVALRRGLPETARDLGRLDPDAIARVVEEARPDVRDAEEVHDALLGLGIARPEPEWQDWFEACVEDKRAAAVMSADGPLWFAVENLPLVESLLPGAPVSPDVTLPESLRGRPSVDAEGAAVAAVRGH